FSRFLSHLRGLPCDLPSFPTRRSSDLGLRIAIDDFGTGHSCLSYLRRFPIDVLKIDRSFVNEVGASEDSRIIIDAIISLARSLRDRKSTRLNSSHVKISYAVFCLKKKK